MTAFNCRTEQKKHPVRAFTLIELSIVLVIIGLIVGGILVGRDLINASYIRAQITQIEKYNQAVNTFRGKYSELPGDIESNLVTKFGFTTVPTRAGTIGQGNGDGIIHSISSPTTAYGWGMAGEALLIWADLSANSQLIDGNFSTLPTNGTGVNVTSNVGFAPYLPQAKLGNGNYVATYTYNAVNYFQIIKPYNSYSNSELDATRGMTVSQAYNIDKKMDDGVPNAGNVQATMSVSTDGAGGTIADQSNPPMGGLFTVSTFAAATSSPTTCYESTTNTYSMSQNNGSGVNCALSFKFQ